MNRSATSGGSPFRKTSTLSLVRAMVVFNVVRIKDIDRRAPVWLKKCEHIFGHDLTYHTFSAPWRSIRPFTSG